jgi:hypothetical protein
MKPRKLVVWLIMAGLLATFAFRLLAANGKPSASVEYVTIRWGGRENTHIIRPGGQVEFIGIELRKVPKPDRTDERAFYMNMAMNGLVKEGYEFAGMTTDEIVMKRSGVK